MPTPTIRSKVFWQGFLALLVAFAVAQLSLQVDVVMLAQRVPGMTGAYVMLTRLVVIDLVVTMAYGAVVSVAIAQAVRQGNADLVVRWSLGLASLIGLLLLVAGWVFYPMLAPWVAGGDVALVAMLKMAIPWFAVGAPFRVLNACAAFALHATQQGTYVVRWKLCEVGAKVAMNIVFLDLLDAGFAGCFMASLLVHATSSGWVLLHLHRQTGGFPTLPPRRWSGEQAVKSAWETQRILAMQLLGLLTIGLFASPWISTVTPERLDAFGAGLALAMLVFAPIAAFSRFLAIRFSARSAREVDALMHELLTYGVAVATSVAILLALGQHWLGQAIYTQEGLWWATFIWSLALSLPLRLAANILRAAMQSRGSFNSVAKADTLLSWGLGLPLVVVGLNLELPMLAYTYLWLPETAVLAWLTFRYRALARRDQAPAGAVEKP